MKVKILEIRDRATYYAVVCTDMNPDPTESGFAAQCYHLRRRGFPCDGVPNIAIHAVNCGGEPCWNDPFGWVRDRFQSAHEHIIDHWAELVDGDVIDIEFILGETTTKKESERASMSI